MKLNRHERKQNRHINNTVSPGGNSIAWYGLDKKSKRVLSGLYLVVVEVNGREPTLVGGLSGGQAGDLAPAAVDVAAAAVAIAAEDAHRRSLGHHLVAAFALAQGVLGQLVVGGVVHCGDHQTLLGERRVDGAHDAHGAVAAAHPDIVPLHLLEAALAQVLEDALLEFAALLGVGAEAVEE